MEVLHTAPSHSSFTPLSQFQSETPDSFHDGPAVLYHHTAGTTLRIPRSEFALSPSLGSLANGESTTSVDNSESEVEITGIDVWITSEKFIIYSTAQQTGLAIPYPLIALHAIQTPSTNTTSLDDNPAEKEEKENALYLQILHQPEPVFDDHDPDATISLIVYVPSSARSRDGAVGSVDGKEGVAGQETGEGSEAKEVQDMFNALSACANLHPDVTEDDEEGEEPPYTSIGEGDGLPPPFPGSGGWITAENVDQVSFDQEGNITLGTVRARDDGEDEDRVNGHAEEEETKWRRLG